MSSRLCDTCRQRTISRCKAEEKTAPANSQKSADAAFLLFSNNQSLSSSAFTTLLKASGSQVISRAGPSASKSAALGQADTDSTADRAGALRFRGHCLLFCPAHRTGSPPSGSASPEPWPWAARTICRYCSSRSSSVISRSARSSGTVSGQEVTISPSTMS